MSVAEHLTVEIQPDTPRRPHAAVAALVGGPYPNLVTTRRPRPRLVPGPEAPSPAPAGSAPAPADEPPDGPALDLRRTGDAGFPAGGPYPNLSTARR
jgi:hypothetical protein